MHGMDFNNCVENIPVYAMLFNGYHVSGPGGGVAGRAENLLAIRRDGHMQGNVIQMALGILYLIF